MLTSVTNAPTASLRLLFFYTALVILVITGLFTYAANEAIGESQNLITSEAQKVKLILQDEVDRFVYGLQGVKGAFIASDRMLSAERFREYAESRKMFENFSGALGFGFIRAVEPSELEAYSSRLKVKRPHFKVHPQVESDIHMVIELIEPSETNAPAVGLDVSFEKHRKDAALKAARDASATLTEPITLVQRQKSHVGFLIFLPIYDQAPDPESERSRMEKLVGWAYAPVVLEDLLNSAATKIPNKLSVRVQIDENNIRSIGPNRSSAKIFDTEASSDFIVAGSAWKITVSQSIAAPKLLALGSFYILSLFLIVVGSSTIWRRFSTADRRLAQANNWLDAVIKSAAHSIIATNPNGVITTFSAGAELMLGYSSDELVGLKTPEVLHDLSEVVARAQELEKELNEKIEPGFEVFIAKARRGFADTNIWTYYKKDKSPISVRLCVTAIFDQQKEIVGYLGIAEDRSEELRLFNTIELQRAQMMEAAKFKILGEMAGGIAHEINTPLGTIMGSGELIEDLLKSNRTEDIPESVHRIISTTERIAKIVRALKDFSRTSGDDAMTSVDLGEVIKSTFELCKKRFNDLDVEFSFVQVEPVQVLGRAVELSQVIMNLMSNSIDAVENLPRKVVRIELTRENGLARITVTDSGNGIPAEIAAKIMNPFFTTKEVGRGTGLGLSISMGILKSHNGSIKLDRHRSNTTFVVELPVLDG